MTALRFIPLDARAKDGGFHLLRTNPADRRDHAEYCARWNAARQRWELGCDCPVEDVITHWATALPKLEAA